MTEITIRDALQAGLREALEDDDDVIIMGEDVGAYGGAYSVTKGLLQDFGPDRIIDTPISEAGFVGAGIGAAIGGLRPIIEFMNLNFALLAFDQMLNIGASIRYMSGGQISVPVVIRAPTGAGVQLGATHSRSYENWLASVPGIKVVAPSTPYDAIGLLRSALIDNNMVVIVEHVLMYGMRGEIPNDRFTVPIGKANVIRSGSDLTIVTYHHGIVTALEAANRLSQKGFQTEVIDLRSLSPLDMDTVLKSVKKTHRAVALEENWRTGGIMAEVASKIHENALDELDGPVARVGSRNTPHPYSIGLEREMIPSADDILEVVEFTYGM